MGWLIDVERIVDAAFAAPEPPDDDDRETSAFEAWVACAFAALIFAAIVYMLLTHGGGALR